MISNFGDPSGQGHVGGRRRDTHTANKVLRQDPPPLDLGFWSFLTFLHRGIEEVEKHLL